MHQTVRHALTLAQGNILRVDDGAGMLVAVSEGEVWITEEGNPRDIVLGPGESFSLKRPGVCLLYAIEPARLTLSAPRIRERPEPQAVFRLVPTLEMA
jgi:hypothetical protein